MSRNDWNELQAVLTDAVFAAIKKVGVGTFLATSMFASNEKKKDDIKKAA